MRQRGTPEVPKLGINETFTFSSKTSGTRLAVEWISSNGMICDLDLYVLFYDERARFIEKLNFDNPVSSDGSSVLTADIDSTAQSSSHEEHVHLNLSEVSPSVSAIALFVDGGPRNFQFVQSIVVHCSQENIETEGGSNFMSKVEPGAYSNQPLFQCINRTRKDFQGVLLNVLYKDGWYDQDTHTVGGGGKGTPIWSFKNIFEPVYVPTIREKDEKCHSLIVHIVPTLEKYRPRLFPSVKSICSALTSVALPKLKKRFQKGNGLPIKQFTEVLFHQLHESYPKILDETEASYTVAMLQDMFLQIDFNGDGTVDWDEFTTFCIHTGLVGTHTSDSNSAATPASGVSSLDEYVIEYCQDNNIKDTFLTNSSNLAVVRYYKEINRILVITDKGDQILMFNDLFEYLASLDPLKLSGEPLEKIKIYDGCYLPSRDLYAYCSSDHSITLCREQCSTNGKRIHYTLYHRIYSSFSYLKLCYSDHLKILCAVGINNIIYGYDVDKIVTNSSTPLFQVSRHKDIVTDFIAIERLDLFLTCSLDKRIVLWSMSTRRVKGVLLGHKRGIRCMSYANGILLTSGFECEARTWDLSLKECTLLLKGHRVSITASKMMCADSNQPDDNLRALTVDASCEFRLWNVHVRERGSQCGFAQVLQVFNLSKEEVQIAPIKFLEFPFHPVYSKGIYSNIIAASSKLIHFTPEKNSAEFVPPTSMCYSEPNTAIAIGIGHHVYKYDITYGTFLTSFSSLDSSDITCFCFDEDHGRRLFIGCNSGNIFLINFSTGVLIDRIAAHSKEVSCIVVIKGSGSLTIFSGSLDGRIRCMEETSGALNIHHTAEQAIGDNCGISSLKVAESLKIIIAGSSGRLWGLWNMTTLKKLVLIEEESTIIGLEILGASGDRVDIREFNARGLPFEQQHILTLAVGTGLGVRIYTIDTLEIRLVVTHFLDHHSSDSLSGMTILRCPTKGSVNYSTKQGKNDSRQGDSMLVATTDEGYILTWPSGQLRSESNAIYRKHYHIGRRNSGEHSSLPSFLGTPLEGSASPSETDEQERHRQVIKELEQVKHSLEGVSFSRNLTSPSIVENSPSSDDCNQSDRSLQDTSRSTDSIFNLTLTLPPMTLYNGLAPKDKRNLRNQKLLLLRSTSNFQVVTNNDLIHGEETKLTQHPIRHWKAHNDVIPCLVPLQEHGCIVTTSLDGYNRIWNLDTDCLGELPLPNLTERMRTRGLFHGESLGWKFILEKIAVTKSHQDIADRLVQSITGSSNSGNSNSGAEVKRHGAIGHEDLNTMRFLSHFHEPSRPLHSLPRTKTADAREYLRTRVLAELSDRHPTVSDWSHDTLPSIPDRLATRRKESQISIQVVQKDENIQSITARNEESLPQPQYGGNDSDSISSIGSLDKSETKIMKIATTPIKGMGRGMKTRTRIEISSSKKQGKLSDSKSVSSLQSHRSHHTTLSKTSNSLFPSEILWSSTTDLNPMQTHAFSETSITMSHHDGLIDSEGHKMLRKINKNPDKVEVYDRLLPEVLLRNPHLTTQVKIPALDSISDSEVSFGNQKEMYRHANKLFQEKKRFSVQQARHVVTLARINANLRHVGSMIYLTEPPKHEINLPNMFVEDEEEDANQGVHDAHQGSLSSSLGPPLPLSRQQSKRLSNIGFSTLDSKILNREQIACLIDKVAGTAETDLPERMPPTYSTKHKDILKRRMEQINQKNSSLSPVALYEKKLSTAIKLAARSASSITAASALLDPSVSAIPTNITLTTRQLLPSYKLADVKHFLEIFQKVDEDYSGDLDPDEWCKFFTSINKAVTHQQARAIFTRVDTYNHGYLSISDLIPVIFANANKETQKLILRYVENEISKRKVVGGDLLSENDLEVLFEYYDENNAGFILVSLIKDRVRSFNLPEMVTYRLFDSLKEMEDDEMVNLSDFKRIFKKYVMA